MFGPGVALNHQVAINRHKDLLAEAGIQQAIDNAFERRPHTIQHRILNLRAMFATFLLRAGSWMMPEQTSRRNTAPRGLELRLGR